MENAAAKDIVDTLMPEQVDFINYDGTDSVLLIATAGAGKTFCCVRRLKKLVERGVDPKRICFFSFTVAATEELKVRVNDPNIKITTIHAFCVHLLHRMGKSKSILTFFDFISWFKEYHKPKASATWIEKEKFYDEITKLYEDEGILSAAISAYKLQSAEGIKCRVPDYLKDYNAFLKIKKGRDFSDMLIEVRNLLKEQKWLSMFRGQYDYIFVDEYQDTSTIQMQILLSLNAKYYYLIGDPSQSIYGYSGANCDMVESMLKRRRTTKDMTLSTNFRSAKLIVEYSNRYSRLQAVPHHQHDGLVTNRIIVSEQLEELLKQDREVVVLARTNSVIKILERRMLMKKVPMRYFNLITKTDIEALRKGEMNPSLKKKVGSVLAAFEDLNELVNFIEKHSEHRSFITSIHKSKGREFDVCVIVNSFSPEILAENNIVLNKEQIKYVSFDPADPEDKEAMNIHYVATSRPKNEMYFMIEEG